MHMKNVNVVQKYKIGIHEQIYGDDQLTFDFDSKNIRKILL